MPSPRTAWILTDGKAGDEQQCLGLAEALGVEAEARRVNPRKSFALFMPWGPIDPREGFNQPASPVAPPFPDLVIASGRRAVPYVRAIRKASRHSFTVFLKDPRTGAGTADFLWVPEHDALRGHNVFATLTPPHRISAARLEAARSQPDARLAGMRLPRAAILVGGDSRHHTFTAKDQQAFSSALHRLAGQGVGLMVSTSRRTPSALAQNVASLVRKTGGFFWDGEGANPYIALLALADMIVVTDDSYNMIGEALAAGAPVRVFHPTGGHAKLDRFITALEQQNYVAPFTGEAAFGRLPPLDATPLIASRLLEAYERFRSIPSPRLR